MIQSLIPTYTSKMVLDQNVANTVCYKVRMAFSKFDTSGDDKLDYKEFCEMIRKKEEEQKKGRK